jgi:hypothetical protein
MSATTDLLPDDVIAPVSSEAKLPNLVEVEGLVAPQAPRDLAETGLDEAVLKDLALKLGYTVPQFTTEWAAKRLHLPQPLVGEILEQLRQERMVDVLGQAGPFGYRFAVGQRGRERAQRLLEISGYVGPAPVTLDAYAAFLNWQLSHRTAISPEQVRESCSELVLTSDALQLAGLAVSSGRSLFVFGPPGNGKSSLARLLHNVLRGELWVPYCLVVENSIIRLYDAAVHERVETPADLGWRMDQRWVRVRRPLVVAGGEMTLESFDLSFSPSLRYYEAPLHVKANGGTLLIDDFGRQRVDPHMFLNRWIIPLEYQIDYLTLHTGQKIQVPFRQMLIIATNLREEEVTDPAFLRRMGYRLYLGKPTPEAYVEIFKRNASTRGLAIPSGLIEQVLRRYEAERRELRGCEPRDLLSRVVEICRFRQAPPHLNQETLHLAWIGYFGNRQPQSESE